MVGNASSTSGGRAGTGASDTRSPGRRPATVPIGRSPHINQLRRIAALIAKRHSTILILGETGSGKGVLARHVHEQSHRANGPFIHVDCSALPDHLFESAMFGHVRGAFTGAVRDTLGFVRAANGGTLFLDEVGELAPHLQAKLLQVLEEKAVTPVGATCSKPIDVRFVTATHRDLQSMVRGGTFRQDLFFRLHVVALYVAPLRDRREDVLPLAEHFISLLERTYNEQPKTLSPEAAALMEAYHWPGNVRELSNAIEQAYVLGTDNIIAAADLPAALRSVTDSKVEGGVALSGRSLLAQAERDAVLTALRRSNGHKGEASRLLGIHVQRLNRYMRRLDIPATSC
jgi:transcriptional regulator with PAS, ATPase and Fis domain